MHINVRYKAYLMLFIAFLAQNVAVGFSFGSIGLLIEPLSRELNAKVALISLSVALVALIASASSPVVGMLLDRWSLRATMAIGCVLCAAGYYCAAHSHSIAMYLGSFAGVGLGFAMMGVIPANKIANIWFPHQRGLAAGIVNIAALPALGPLLFQHAISAYGWRAMLEGFALINLGFVLIVWLIERPRDDASTESTPTAEAIAATSPFKTALFWKLLFAKGLLLGSGVTAITYLAPFALTQGLTPERAAQLLSIEGSVALFGALVFGWLCDRLSPFLVLGINAISIALLWATIVHFADFNSLALLSAGIGLCAAGV
ncbi:MAG TPA: MFS transporter, partial [Spongiibacteraceae bacterium]